MQARRSTAMTDIQKAVFIMMATNDGRDLPELQRQIFMSALRDELGEATRLQFDEGYRQVLESGLEKIAPARGV